TQRAAPRQPGHKDLFISFAEIAAGTGPDQSAAAPSLSSSKPELTSAVMASSASRACRPVAWTRMVAPGPAPSIMSPMMELPATVVPSRTTWISASKHSAVRTKRADARACRPLRLTMVSCCASARPGLAAEFMSRMINTNPSGAKRLAGDGNVLAPGFGRLLERLLDGQVGAHAGELDQHRQVDPADDLDVAVLHGRDGDVGGRTAEHVGEDHDAVALIRRFDAAQDVVAALFHVVIRTDGDGLDHVLRADDMLERCLELHGEGAVRHQNHADHRYSPKGKPRMAGRKSCPAGTGIQVNSRPAGRFPGDSRRSASRTSTSWCRGSATPSCGTGQRATRTPSRSVSNSLSSGMRISVSTRSTTR